jgi:predicted ABC-type exoprotein transport system permease subunit
MKELIQKKGRDFRKYTFGDDGLKAEILLQGNYDLLYIKYEDIGFNETITRKSPSTYQILLLISLIFNFILFFSILTLILDNTSAKQVILLLSGIPLVVLAIFLTKTLLQSGIEKHIAGEAKIDFSYEKNERLKVDAFIASLKTHQKDFIRRKYMRIDQFIPFEQQSKVFLWLFNRSFITRSELEILLEETEKLKAAKEK